MLLLDILEKGPVSTLFYTLVGVVLSILSYKIVDWVTPGDLARQIADDKNLALAIVVAAFVLGNCIIIAASIVS